MISACVAFRKYIKKHTHDGVIQALKVILGLWDFRDRRFYRTSHVQINDRPIMPPIHGSVTKDSEV